jgi:hypothetical protein
VTKFADLLRHSQTLRADDTATNIISSSVRPSKQQAMSGSDSGNDSDDGSRVSSSGDTYSGSDGDGTDDEETGAGGWGARAQPAKAGREAKKRQLQLQQQQQQQKRSHKLKQQQLGRGAGAASAFVSSLRARPADDDVVEDIDVGGGGDRKNRMGQRQVRPLWRLFIHYLSCSLVFQYLSFVRAARRYVVTVLRVTLLSGACWRNGSSVRKRSTWPRGWVGLRSA